MKYIFLVVIFITTNNLFNAQVIKGKLTDAETHETLPGVNIYLPELKKGAVSDIDGKYTLKLPRKGIYKLQISFVGYDIILKTIDVQEDLTLNFELTPTVIETKEFVISSVYHSSQNENPVEVIQFDSKQLTQSSDPTLMQSLTHVAGVNMISTGTNIGKPVIRGLSYNRVLVFSEGIAIDNQQFGDEHGLGLSEIGIDKVEIIKGPSSLFYGADAMGGVLHFISEKPANINTVVGDFGTKYFSNTNGYSSNLGIKGATETFRYRIRGGYASHGDYQQGNNDRVTNTHYTESALKIGVGFMKKWWTNDVNYSFLQSAIGIPESIGEQNTHRELEAPFQIITNHILSTQNTFYIKNSHINLNLGYMMNNRKEFGEGTLSEAVYHNYTAPAILNMALKTTSYDIKWHLPEKKSVELIFGSQGKYQTNRNNGEENLIPDANEQQVGGFVMAKYSAKARSRKSEVGKPDELTAARKLDNKFTTIVGMRYDVKKMRGFEMGTLGGESYKRSFEQFYESYNGSLGFTYQFSEKLLMRTNVASGFRAPNLAELSSNGVHEGTFRYEIGNLALKTEQNFEVDLGFEYVAEHVSVAFSGFNNSINNYIFLSPLDSLIDDAPVFTYNQINANLYGLESTIDIHPHAMHWLHFETNYAMVIAKNSQGEYLPRIPAFNLSNTLKLDLKNWKKLENSFISLTANTTFAQNFISDFETPTDLYVLLDAKIGTEIKVGKQNIEISIGATNLLNKTYYNHLSRLKADGIYDMGRNLVVSVKIPFGIK